MSDAMNKERGFDLDVFARLGVSLENLAAQVKRRQDAEDARAQSLPSDPTIVQALIYPASGNLSMDFGSPPLGFAWQVRAIIIGGSHANDVAAGDVYIFRQGPNPTDLPTATCVDLELDGLANRAFYSTRQFTVRGQEHVWAVITGGTPGQQYVGGVTVEQVALESLAGTFSEY